VNSEEAIDVQFSHSVFSSNLFLLPVIVDKGGKGGHMPATHNFNIWVVFLLFFY